VATSETEMLKSWSKAQKTQIIAYFQ